MPNTPYYRNDTFDWVKDRSIVASWVAKELGVSAEAILGAIQVNTTV
jgi:hypothetical protein